MVCVLASVILYEFGFTDMGRELLGSAGAEQREAARPFALSWFFIMDPVLGREEDAGSVYADV